MKVRIVNYYLQVKVIPREGVESFDKKLYDWTPEKASDPERGS